QAAARQEQTNSRVTFDEQALEELYRLHTRFATYSALPAVALQLMRSIADRLSQDVGPPVQYLDGEAEEGQPAQTDRGPEPGRPLHTVRADEVARAFAKQSGLPEFLVDDSIALDLS